VGQFTCPRLCIIPRPFSNNSQYGFPRRRPDNHLTKRRQHTHTQPTPACKQNDLELPSLPLTPAMFSRLLLAAVFYLPSNDFRLSPFLILIFVVQPVHFLSVTSFPAPCTSYVRTYIPVRPVTNGALRAPSYRASNPQQKIRYCTMRRWLN